MTIAWLMAAAECGGRTACRRLPHRRQLGAWADGARAVGPLKARITVAHAIRTHAAARAAARAPEVHASEPMVRRLAVTDAAHAAAVAGAVAQGAIARALGAARARPASVARARCVRRAAAVVGASVRALPLQAAAPAKTELAHAGSRAVGMHLAAAVAAAVVRAALALAASSAEAVKAQARALDAHAVCAAPADAGALCTCFACPARVAVASATRAVARAMGRATGWARCEITTLTTPALGALARTPEHVALTLASRGTAVARARPAAAVVGAMRRVAWAEPSTAHTTACDALPVAAAVVGAPACAAIGTRVAWLADAQTVVAGALPGAAVGAALNEEERVRRGLSHRL